MKTRRLVCEGLIGSALLVQCVGASDGNPGRDAYFKYCSSCHGADGRGDGEAAGKMKPKPSDLTQLAKKHGGTFPTAWVKDIIDGRQSIPAHGRARMPVWGHVFSQEPTHETAEAHSRSQVQLLTDYLRSIQTN